MKFQKYLWLVSFLVFLVFQCSDVKANESPNNAMFNDLLINNEVQKNHSYCSNQYIKAVNHLSYINSERIEEINGNLFYFDINGNMKTDAGWISYKGKRYYADTGGKLFRDQTISFGSKEIYYMSNDGSVFSGVKELNGSLFYFDSKSNGKLVNTAGWILFDGKQYYADTGGKLFRNQTISFGSDIIYYMSSDGSVFSGIKELNGEMVYFDLANEGKMRLNAGWVYFGGKSYYAQTGGAFFRSQIITFGVDIAYYVGLDGSVRSGLIDYKGDSYYFDEKNGDKRIFGVKEINNKLYYFDRQNQGKQIKNVGWIIDGSKRYYAKVGGELFRNEMISFGSDYMYYMGNDGSVQSGIRELSDGRLFYFDPSDNSNIRRWKGWLYSDGKRYYTAQGGELYKNQMITFGANVGYYMGEDGSVQIGVRAVGKNYYKFDGYGSYTMAGHFEYKNGKTYYYDHNGKMVTDWYFIDGAKYFFNPIGEMIGKGPVKKAIDISEHNKIIDWDTVKREGDIDFVILRVGFGSYSEDKMFERNLRELRRIGMPFQIYLYSYAENAAEARAEARFVDSMMKKYKIDKNTKIYYDIEKPEYINNTEIIITKDQYLQIIPTFMNELTSLGYKDLSLYSYRYYLETVLNSPVILKYVTWVAEYGNNLLYKGDYTGWQYSSNGAVPGISTRVDLNVFFN